MKFPIQKILNLRSELLEKAGLSEPMTHAKCRILSERLNEMIEEGPEISTEYIYNNLYLSLKKNPEDKEAKHGLNTEYTEKLLAFVGIKNISEWIDSSVKRKLSKEEKALLGVWNSYVKCNSGKEDVLLSPILIYSDNQGITMKLQGKQRSYQGKIEISNGCLFTSISTSSGRKINLIGKIGFNQEPELIQCVYSAVSSAGDPIAGKELLVRTTKTEIEEGYNQRLSIEAMIKSSEPSIQAIGRYFSKAHYSVAKIRNVSTFTLDDIL